MTRSRLAITAKVLAALAVIALLVGAAVWRAEGGRWFDVRTGSMGQAAPVGSLLLVRPAGSGPLEVGDMVTFRVPGSGSVYTHRLHSFAADGIHTKGDVNGGVDPWVLHRQDVIGKVAVVIPAAGFVLQGLPLLLVVIGTTWVVSLFVRTRWRSAVRVAGFGLAFAVTCFMLQPWVGLARIGVTGTGDGAVLEAVSTGLLPVKAGVADEPRSERVYSGQVTKIRVPDNGKRYHVSAVPSLTGWWWAVVVAVCCGPLLWTLLFGVTDQTGRRAAT